MRLTLSLILPLLLLMSVLASAQTAEKTHCQFKNVRYPAKNIIVTDMTLRGMNEKGSMVGGYTQLVNVRGGYGYIGHGFLRTENGYFPIDVPGAAGTTPLGINDRGKVVGIYTNGHDKGKAFLLSPSGYTRITVNGFSTIVPSAINNAGVIVGSVERYQGTTIVRAEGFIMKGEKVELVAFPGANGENGTWTALGDINQEGTIVGNYGIIDGKTPYGLATMHGLTVKKGVLSTLDYPGAMWTSLARINDKGEILGEYWTANTNNSFIGKTEYSRLCRRMARLIAARRSPVQTRHSSAA